MGQSIVSSLSNMEYSFPMGRQQGLSPFSFPKTQKRIRFAFDTKIPYLHMLFCKNGTDPVSRDHFLAIGLFYKFLHWDSVLQIDRCSLFSYNQCYSGVIRVFS